MDTSYQQMCSSFSSTTTNSGNNTNSSKDLFTTSSTNTRRHQHHQQQQQKFSVVPLESSASRHSAADRDEVFAFMQTQFRLQEPITSALKCSAKDTAVFYTDICAECFKHDGLSLIARDSRDQQQLAGIVLNSIWQPAEKGVEEGGGKQEKTNGPLTIDIEEEKKMEFGPEIRTGPYESANANRLAIYLGWTERGIASLFPEAGKILKLDILAVHPMFLRQGLASHLVAKSVQLARLAGCSHVVTSATAVASQQLFKRFGFKTVRKVRFDQFLEDGLPVYRNLHDNGTGAELMALAL